MQPLLTPAFFVVSAAHFLLATTFWSFPLFPLYFGSAGASAPEIGFLMAIEPLAAIAVRPLAGRWTAVRGCRWTFRVAALVHLVGLLGYLVVPPRGPEMILVRLVHGAGIGALFATFFTYASEIAPPARRTEGLALFGTSGLLPAAIAPFVGEEILVAHGFPTLFLALALLAAGSGALSWNLPDTRAARGVPEHSFGGLVLLVSLRRIWATSLAFSVAMASYVTFLAPHARGAGLSRMATFFATYAAAAILLRLFGGWIPDRVGPARIVAPALASLSAGLGLLVLLPEIPTTGMLVAAGCLCGIGHGYLFPVLTSLAVERTPPLSRGNAVSLFTAIIDTGHIVGPLLFGAIAGAFGYPALFGVAAAVTLVAGVAWTPDLLWRKEDGVESAETIG